MFGRIILLALVCVKVILAKEDNPICHQPKVVGPCRAMHQRFFYNTETKQCEKFIYGGCKGNQNNFEQLETCQQTCEGAGDSPSGFSERTVNVDKDHGPRTGDGHHETVIVMVAKEPGSGTGTTAVSVLLCAVCVFLSMIA